MNRFILIASVVVFAACSANDQQADAIAANSSAGNNLTDPAAIDQANIQGEQPAFDQVQNEASQAPPKNDPMFFVVGFMPTSDIELKDWEVRLQRAVKSFESANGVTLPIERIAWGPQGEVDYCIDLTNIDRKLEPQLVQGIHQNFMGNPMVRLEHHPACPRKEMAK